MVIYPEDQGNLFYVVYGRILASVVMSVGCERDVPEHRHTYLGKSPSLSQPCDSPKHSARENRTASSEDVSYLRTLALMGPRSGEGCNRIKRGRLALMSFGVSDTDRDVLTEAAISSGKTSSM